MIIFPCLAEKETLGHKASQEIRVKKETLWWGHEGLRGHKDLLDKASHTQCQSQSQLSVLVGVGAVVLTVAEVTIIPKPTSPTSTSTETRTPTLSATVAITGNLPPLHQTADTTVG
jgi:hypothetical protein